MAEKRATQWIGTIAVVVVLLALTVYTLFQCGAFTSKQLLTTEFTSDVIVERILGATGYFFRTETVILADGPSVSDVSLASGEKVSAGTELARLYACGTEAQARERQKKLDEIDERIRFLILCGSTEGLKLSDADALRTEWYAAYRHAIAQAEHGNVTGASAATEELLVALSRYERLIGRSDGTDVAVAALREERRTLLTGTPTIRVSEASGYFYGVGFVDGYESVYRAEGLLEAGADEILMRIGREPEKPSYAAGKLVTDFQSYLAVPVSEEDGATVELDTRYTLSLTSPEGVTVEVPMVLEQRKTASDGSCVLIFSCNRMSVELMSCREVKVSLVTGSLTGYRVPLSAVVEQNGVTGVYILEESTAHFRLIEMLAQYKDYCVVTPQNALPEEYDHTQYLNRGDRLILDGEDLYDGKQYP